MEKLNQQSRENLRIVVKICAKSLINRKSFCQVSIHFTNICSVKLRFVRNRPNFSQCFTRMENKMGTVECAMISNYLIIE